MMHEECDCANCVAQKQFNPLAWAIYHPGELVEAVAVHAVPDNDIHMHRLADDGQCPCNPWIDEEQNDLFFVHRAFDGREAFARGERKLS